MMCVEWLGKALYGLFWLGYQFYKYTFLAMYYGGKHLYLKYKEKKNGKIR